MGVVFFLLCLAMLLCMVLGLIKPTLVLPWGKNKTRGRAFGWYLLFAFLSLSLGVMFVDKDESPSSDSASVGTNAQDQPAKTQESGSNNKTGNDSEYVIKIDLDGDSKGNSLQSGNEYKEEEKLVRLYCDFSKKMRETRQEASKKFGYDPQNAFSIGDVVTVEQETIMQVPLASGITDESSMMKKVSSVVRIKPGDKLVIIKVMQDSGGHHWYEAKTVKTSQRGYIRSMALSWFVTVERSSKHARKIDAWTEPRYKELEKIFFTANGLERWEIEDRATKGVWRLQCKDSK